MDEIRTDFRANHNIYPNETVEMVVSQLLSVCAVLRLLTGPSIVLQSLEQDLKSDPPCHPRAVRYISLSCKHKVHHTDMSGLWLNLVRDTKYEGSKPLQVE